MVHTIKSLWIPLVMVCGVALFYSPALSLPLLGDDLGIVERLYQLEQEGKIWEQVANDFYSTLFDFGGNYYRPFVTVAFAWDYILWQTNPFGYHLTNLLLHLANTLFVYEITHRLLYALIGKRTALLLSLLAALFFALRPVNSEVVLWVSGRGDSLALCGMLLAVYGYLQAQGQWNRWYLLAIFGFMFGLGSKEPAATLPAILVGLHLFGFIAPYASNNSSKSATTLQHLWAHGKALLPFILITGGYFLWRMVLFGSATQVYETAAVNITDPMWYNPKIASLRYFVTPRFLPGWDTTFVNYSMLFIFILGTIGVLLSPLVLRLWGLAGVWLLSILIPALPQLYISPLGEQERLFYIPTVPLALLVAGGISGLTTHWHGWKMVQQGTATLNLIVVVLVLSITSGWQVQRMNEWMAVGDQLTEITEAIRTEAAEVATGQTRLLIVPGTVDGIFFGRNAQGPLMMPPHQPASLYGPVFIHASEQPCAPPTFSIELPVIETKCWNIKTEQFEPFDPDTYNPENYPTFWLLNPEKRAWFQ